MDGWIDTQTERQTARQRYMHYRDTKINTCIVTYYKGTYILYTFIKTQIAVHISSLFQKNCEFYYISCSRFLSILYSNEIDLYP